MQPHTMPAKNGRLPISRRLLPSYMLSLIVVVLIAGSSIAGIALRASIYPTEDLRHWYVLTDWLNLCAVLPLLLGAMWLTRRGHLIGLLCWPGVLYAALYLYIPYVIAVPFGPLFLPHLALVTLSAGALLALVASIDGERVRERLCGAVPARVSGALLLFLGALTLVYQVALIVTALTEGTTVPASEIAPWVADLTVGGPILVVVGAQLWRRESLGFVGGAGMLLAFGVLALGLVPGLLAEKPVDVAGVVMVATMAGVCLVPLTAFLRGAARET